jgi:hypothetical protein
MPGSFSIEAVPVGLLAKASMSASGTKQTNSITPKAMNRLAGEENRK